MKIEVLQAFVAVAEHRSFSKAAEILYLSQSTVSRYIGELERQIGIVLFVRNAHTCELTMVGKQVYVHARRIVNEWKSIEALAEIEENELGKRIRIGYNYEEELKLITPVLEKVGISSKTVEVSVRFGDGEDITRFVREGKLDCAIMHLPSVARTDGLDIRLICKCNMCMYASEKHRLAEYKSLKLEQVIHETDVRVSGELNFYKQVDEAFQNLNLPQIKHVYVQNAMDCLPSISYNNCISFYADIYPTWPGCVKVLIEDWTTDFSLVFVTREGCVSSAAERLYNALCTSLKKNEEAVL